MNRFFIVAIVAMASAALGLLAPIAASEGAQRAAVARPLSLVLVDETLADHDVLVDGLRGRPDIIIEKFKVKDSRLSEVATIVAKYHDLASIHILSHGAEGQLEVSGQALDDNSLEQAQEAFSAMAKSLSVDGEVLFYGCEIGAGGRGKSFVEHLKRMLGHNVAASTNITGAANLGGDWILERQTGPMKTAALAFPAYSFALWNDQSGIGGWYADMPFLTPDFTDSGTNRFTSVGPISGSGSNSDYNFTIQNVGGQTMQEIYVSNNNNAPVSFDAAMNGGYYMFADLAPSVVQQISNFGFVASSSNIGSARAAVVLYDTVTHTLYTLNGGFAIQGNSSPTTVSVSNAPTMIPGRTYQLRIYMWGSPTTYMDNPRFSTQLNEAPSARADAFATPYQTTLNGNLFSDNGAGTDSDPEGQSFSITAVDSNSAASGSSVSLSHGQLTISDVTSGAFSFVPSPGFSGTQTFAYTIDDGFGGTSSATVTINVGAAPNNPKLTISKKASTSGPVSAGQTVTYTYAVANAGNVPITNIKVSDVTNCGCTFPTPAHEALTLRGSTSTSADGTSNDGVWDKLDPLDEVTFTASYVVTQHDVDYLQ